MTPCNEMINPEMLLPPLKELLNIPSEPVYQGDLFRCQIMAVRCNEIFRISDAVSDNPDGLFGLICTGSSQAGKSIAKDAGVSIT